MITVIKNIMLIILFFIWIILLISLYKKKREKSFSFFLIIGILFNLCILYPFKKTKFTKDDLIGIYEIEYKSIKKINSIYIKDKYKRMKKLGKTNIDTNRFYNSKIILFKNDSFQIINNEPLYYTLLKYYKSGTWKVYDDKVTFTKNNKSTSMNIYHDGNIELQKSINAWYCDDNCIIKYKKISIDASCK